MQVEPPRSSLDEAAAQLEHAAAAKKCWTCGCLRQSLETIERAVPPGEQPERLTTAIRDARAHLAPVRYDCLGCPVCYPALAVNALAEGGSVLAVEVCPTEQVEEREGWPPLAGSYTVQRYQAPVAVCTLTDDELAQAVAARAHPAVAIVGTVQTENLGIERVIRNTLANPNIRFLIVCGADSRQAIGHLPGQSLVALGRSGIDAQGRIIDARGKRPVLHNVSPQGVEHFRETVEMLDLVGTVALPQILAAVEACAARNPGAAEPFTPTQVVPPVAGYLPARMLSDPAGYFVVYLDRAKQLLILEHYRPSGVLDAIIQGHTATELYTPAIEKELVSRLDHAAYLGRELARAEEALRTGQPYVQDAAPHPLPDGGSPGMPVRSCAVETTPQEQPCSCGS